MPATGEEEQKDAYNLQLANRQIEINEWTYQNRMETLFIFQLLFISLMIVAVLLYMKGLGIVGGAFVVYTISLLALVFITIIINRTVYTNTKRDTRMWSKRRFADDNKLDSPLGRGGASGRECAPCNGGSPSA